MSDDAIAKSYADNVKTDNLNSPYSTYGKDKFITIHVLAVNQLNADHRIKIVIYDSNNVTLIKAHYGYETEIVFNDNESVQNV